MTPKDLANQFPYSSVLQNAESETVALNIVKILERTTNSFRLITWEEYGNERLKDGNFTNRENPYFDKVQPYFETLEKAVSFSPEWKKIFDNLNQN